MINLKIDTNKKHKISTYLYMQFMEPLGTADTSIDAAWDFEKNEWFSDVIEKVNELGPTMVRFGGTFIDYYHWKEAVGKERTPMINYCWGGIYHNLVGTHEVADFCKKVNAEPLIVVNMESDGFEVWKKPGRTGTAAEAAEWVDYCNNPNNAQRIADGVEEPYNVKYWQIGNETSYKLLRHTGFKLDECYDATCRFAEAMKKADPTIKLIGWGDKSYDGIEWAGKMSEIDNIEMLAFHHHFNSGLPNSPLRGTDYRLDWENTWNHLMYAHNSLDEHIKEMRATSHGKRLAITEGHFGLEGRNRNEVLSSWGAGVAYARCLNTIMRHSDIVDIATMADFFGTVWQVNAIILPYQIHFYEGWFKPYLQPVGSVMSLFRHHQGDYMVDTSYNGAIDAVSSVTDNKYFLHIANTDMNYSQDIKLDIGDKKIKSATMYYIVEKADVEITQVNRDVFSVKTQEIENGRFTLPAAAVAAIEIIVE